jgi:hypothetical protein
VAGESRGGPSSYYRLTLGPVTPSTVIVAQAPAAVVKPGAKVEWSLTVYQWYQPRELTVQVEGLPKGVTAEPVKIAARPRYPDTLQIKLVLAAAADAPPGSAVVRIVATAPDAPSVEATWMLTGDGGVGFGTGATGKLVVLVPTP